MAPSRARPPAKPAPPAGEDDGLLRIGEAAKPEAPKYEPRFSIGGNAQQVRVNPPGSYMVKYLHELRRGGGNLAMSWLLERMLHPDAYEVMMTDERVGDADVRVIVRLCAQIVTGARPSPK